MSTSRPPTPRHMGPYSPRRPSPLGFPPLAPHVAFQQPTYAWPPTPDRVIQPKGPSNIKVAFPSEARRPPLAGSTRRPKSQPPPPLKLDDQNHSLYPPPFKTALTITVEEPDSVSSTPSDTSSLSLYSPEDEDVTKNFPIEAEQRQEVEKKKNILFCCFGFFSRSERAKEAKILGPPSSNIVQPAPVPEMTQIVKRRPSPLNL